LGSGLVVSEGALWKRQKGLIGPGFGKKALDAMMVTMRREVEDMLNRWAESKSAAISLAREMEGLALNIAQAALFGYDRRADFVPLRTAIVNAGQYLQQRWPSAAHAAKIDASDRRLAFEAAMAEINRTVDAIIAERRKSKSARLDLLQHLIDARDPATGEPMPDSLLRDEVKTLLISGHETTASALTWALYLLARNPAVMLQVVGEIDALDGQWRQEGIEEGKNPILPVIYETLRLYPPIWIILRTAQQEDIIEGVAVPPRCVCICSPYATHRNPAFWSQPEHFDPGRFATVDPPNSLSRGYFPFGAGPRRCIGEQFARREAELALPLILDRFGIQFLSDHLLEPRIGATMGPDGAVEVSIIQRR
jgi:cytochrome P450